MAEQNGSSNDKNWFMILTWFLAAALVLLFFFLVYQRLTISKYRKINRKHKQYLGGKKLNGEKIPSLHDVSNELQDLKQKVDAAPKDPHDMANKIIKIQDKYNIRYGDVSAPLTEKRDKYTSYRVTYNYKNESRKDLLESLLKIESELPGLKVLILDTKFDDVSDKCKTAKVTFHWYSPPKSAE